MNKIQTQNYWFKRRRYGYGWTPVTRQGWVTIFAFIIVALGGTYFIDEAPTNSLTTGSLIYLACLVASIAALFVIFWLKGPKPKWRWGSKPTDNPKEDI